MSSGTRGQWVTWWAGSFWRRIIVEARRGERIKIRCMLFKLVKQVLCYLQKFGDMSWIIMVVPKSSSIHWVTILWCLKANGQSCWISNYCPCLERVVSVDMENCCSLTSDKNLHHHILKLFRKCSHWYLYRTSYHTKLTLHHPHKNMKPKNK